MWIYFLVFRKPKFQSTHPRQSTLHCVGHNARDTLPPMPGTIHRYGTIPNSTGEILRQHSSYAHGDMLDIGAGSGKYKKIFQDRVTSYKALETYAAPHIDIVGNAEHVPCQDRSFDTILCCEVLEHVPHPWKVVSESYRLLRDGGVAIFTVPFLIPYHPDPGDYFRITDQGLTSLCEENGFVVRVCTGYGGIPTTLAEMLKMAWCSPYEKHTRWKKAIFRMVHRFLTSFKTTPRVIYANTMAIAQKN